jgi:hypothetical protein
MKNRSIIFLCIFSLACYGKYSFAQENVRYHEPKINIDSIFGSNSLNADIDSIDRFRHSRDFAYMHYIDSLLRKKTLHKTDTVTLREQTISRERQEKPEDHSALNAILNSAPVQLFFWLLAIIFLGFILYNLVIKNSFFKRERKAGEENKAGTEPSLSDASNYLSLIEEAESKEDLNLAIRFLFLRMLAVMADKEIINFSPEKTNHDYLKEVPQKDRNSYASLMRNYEYIWYGKFTFGKEHYARLKKAFTDFTNKLNVG